MINKDFNSILELLETFNTEQVCIDHLEKLRWNGRVVSPFDATSIVYKCKGNQYRCRNTGRYFNVRTNTMFDNTKLELKKWFVAIYLVTSHKKGISSLQLSKDIHVTQKTAWFVLQRIRNCFGCENENELNNEVEIDETFVGGKNKNRHADKKVENAQGRSVKDKTPILGMVERSGKITAMQVQNTSSEQLTPGIVKYVKEATIYTDEWVGYRQIDKIYNHLFVKHNEKEYVNGRIHTNTIEGFWSILKRGIVGIYHFTSRKHLQKYVDEFAFRYNTRSSSENSRFNLLLCNSNKRLTYKKLVYG